MKKKLNYRKALVVLLLFITQSVSAQHVTLSNNLLYDAMLTPNLNIGYAPDSTTHWSYGFTAGFACWPSGNFTKRKLRHLLLSPEVRYWTDSLKVGHFFGANFIYSHFNAGYTNLLLYKGVKDERRQGDLIALGVDEHGDYWLSLGSGKSAFVLPQLGLNFVYHFSAFSKKQDNSKSYGILKSSDIERK